MNTRVENEDRRTGRGRAIALILLVAAFGALRVASALNDLYIDEIWSLHFASRASSVIDVFSVRHDNNHILNTVYLYFAGSGSIFPSIPPVFIHQRLLSVAAGTFSLGVLAYIGLKRGFIEAMTLVLIAGASYPLVLYSSEARGYAPSILFALIAFALAGRWLKTRSAVILPFYWASVSLGLLSHSSFFYVLLALSGWSVAGRLKSGLDNIAIRDLILFNAVPFAVLAALYIFFISGIAIGGGTRGDIFGATLHASKMAFGVPGTGWASNAAGAAIALFFFVSGVLMELRSGSGRWVFFALCIVVAPALAIAAAKPEFFYFRYFIVSFPFLYILAAFVLARAFRWSSAGKALYAACMALFLLSNLYSDWRLATVGRGAYFDAMMFMADNAPGGEAAIGSDHDFRNKAVLSFYAKFLPEGRTVTYFDRNEWPENGPGWLILHSVDPGYKPYERTFDAGVEYSLAKSYGFAGDSGFSWHIYRKAGP